MKAGTMTVALITVAGLAVTGCSTTPGQNSDGTAGTKAKQQQTVQIDSSLSKLSDGYFQANAAVDKFLNDWLTLNSKDGIALLTSSAKQGKSPPQLTHYFTQMPPVHESYEIIGYEKVSDTKYQFHVWMYGNAPGMYGAQGRPRPKPETVTVVERNDAWYINNLPKF